MQDAVLLLFRHLIQYVSDHPEDHECHEDKEDLLILQHAEGSAFVLQIIQSGLCGGFYLLRADQFSYLQCGGYLCIPFHDSACISAFVLL